MTPERQTRLRQGCWPEGCVRLGREAQMRSTCKARPLAVSLLVLTACCASTAGGGKSALCLGSEQCTWDKTAQRQVCRCDGWASPPASSSPDQGVFRR